MSAVNQRERDVVADNHFHFQFRSVETCDDTLHVLVNSVTANTNDRVRFLFSRAFRQDFLQQVRDNFRVFSPALLKTFLNMFGNACQAPHFPNHECRDQVMRKIPPPVKAQHLLGAIVNENNIGFRVCRTTANPYTYVQCAFTTVYPDCSIIC